MHGLSPSLNGAFDVFLWAGRWDLMFPISYRDFELRNEKGHYEERTPPINAAAELSDFIRARGTAWNQHVWRRRS
jgi:hypothetical protein